MSVVERLRALARDEAVQAGKRPSEVGPALVDWALHIGRKHAFNDAALVVEHGHASAGASGKRLEWEMVVCSSCGHEDVRFAGRRFETRCRCGGRRELFELRRGKRLETEPTSMTCAMSLAGVSATPISGSDPLRTGAEATV